MFFVEFDNVPDQFKGSQLKDTRTLIEGGEVMKVALELQLAAGTKVKVNRYFHAADEPLHILIAQSPKTKEPTTVRQSPSTTHTRYCMCVFSNIDSLKTADCYYLT